MKIPYSLKKQCVEMANGGKSQREVYNKLFSIEHSEMGFETFRHKLRIWQKCKMADEKTLYSGTYKGFIPHAATVQINGEGEVTQAWIKQSATDSEWDKLLETIRENVKPEKIEPITGASASGMLEIPLFDMHFPIGTYEYYKPTQAEIIQIIQSRSWEEINIIVGQDLFHTNDMKGHTVKGTYVGEIDVPLAWSDARRFWLPIISEAIKHSGKAKIIYSKGNHDACLAWAFVQELIARFPQIEFDDSMEPKKAIHWKRCFIGVGHCEDSNNPKDMFASFVCEFPMEFAESDVQEIHSGHLHCESVDKGMMVRRLASGVPTDKWNKDHSFNTAQKRFQIFEWEPSRLKAIYYV